RSFPTRRSSDLVLEGGRGRDDGGHVAGQQLAPDSGEVLGALAARGEGAGRPDAPAVRCGEPGPPAARRQPLELSELAPAHRVSPAQGSRRITGRGSSSGSGTRPGRFGLRWSREL